MAWLAFPCSGVRRHLERWAGRLKVDRRGIHVPFSLAASFYQRPTNKICLRDTKNGRSGYPLRPAPKFLFLFLFLSIALGRSACVLSGEMSICMSFLLVSEGRGMGCCASRKPISSEATHTHSIIHDLKRPSFSSVMFHFFPLV